MLGLTDSCGFSRLVKEGAVVHGQHIYFLWLFSSCNTFTDSFLTKVGEIFSISSAQSLVHYALTEKHHTTCCGLYGSCVNYIALEQVSNSSGDTRTFPCTAKGWKCETNLEYEMGILMI